MKICPFCAEDIQDAAIKCKHCGEFLDGRAAPLAPKPKVPFYFRTTFIVIAFCCVGPIALPLVWIRPDLSSRARIFWSIIMVVLSMGLYFVTMRSVETIQEYYELIEDF